jgi:hypothetical protein
MTSPITVTLIVLIFPRETVAVVLADVVPDAFNPT